MKLLYFFTNKTKTLTTSNIFQAENMLQAYELLIDIINNEVDCDNKFTDAEIKKMFASDTIDLHEGNFCRIINYNGRDNIEKIANKDFNQISI